MSPLKFPVYMLAKHTMFLRVDAHTFFFTSIFATRVDCTNPTAVLVSAATHGPGFILSMSSPLVVQDGPWTPYRRSSKSPLSYLQAPKGRVSEVLLLLNQRHHAQRPLAVAESKPIVATTWHELEGYRSRVLCLRHGRMTSPVRFGSLQVFPS